VHLLAVSIIVAGIFTEAIILSSSHHAPTTVKPTTVSTGKTSAAKGGSGSSSAVVAKPSDHLIIPTLGVNAPVIKQGVAADGTIATPDNLWQVSLYTGGQQPGQEGNVIIVGHSGAPNQIGVFRHLPNIAIGSDITYKTVSGTQYVYQVVSKKSYGATDPAAKVDIYTPTDKPMLHLITCDGTWVNSTYSYTQRMVVDAVLIGS
jgi:sortase (surface protein transpeptidase)